MVLSSTDAVTGEVSYASPVMFCIVGVVCVGAAVGVGLVRRSRQVAVAAVADKEAAVATTRDQLTRQEERELIAREVHDTVAHHISLISLQASALEVDRGADEPAVRAAAQQMRSSAQQAIAEMRGLVTTLRTGGPDDTTPGATLEDLAGLLDVNPGTMLHHVRTLVETGLLAAQPERVGARGAREVPYRATGLSWRAPRTPNQSVVLLETMRQQLAGLDPEVIDTTWLGLRLDADHLDELRRRLSELAQEFKDRGPDPDGEAYSLVTVLHPDVNPPAPASAAADATAE